MLFINSDAMYCDERVSECMLVCSSVCPLVYLKHTCKLHRLFLHVTRGRNSILLWRHWNTLCTSGFVDDVIFFRNGPMARGVGNINVEAMLKQVDIICSATYSTAGATLTVFVVVYNGSRLRTGGRSLMSAITLFLSAVASPTRTMIGSLLTGFCC